MMKIRFYPKKETVRGILQESLNSVTKLVSDSESKLGKLQDAALFRADSTSESYQAALDHNREVLARAKARLEAFDSHAPVEVMAEIEL